MKRDNFKVAVGLAFVIGHFIIIIWAILCYFLHGFKFEELTTTVGLLIPLFATYSSAIVKDIITNAEKHTISSRKVNKPFVIITSFLLSIFFLFLITIITLKAFNYAFEDFEQFKVFIGIGEAIFGAYVAQIIFSMYDRPTSQTPPSQEEG